MAENRRCPECGTELAPNRQEDLCPRCLLQLALDPNDPDQSPTTKQPLDQPDEISESVAGYRILEVLGEGASGSSIYSPAVFLYELLPS